MSNTNTQGNYTYTGENPNPTWYQKANSFLNSNPWGGVISSGIDLAGGLIKQPPGYSGKRGGIQAGMDKTYDAAANAVMAIPGWGTVAGLGMKALGVLNKGMQRLGAGTDGMTTTDAVLNSAFLAPIGWINGFFGKKANSYTRNAQLDTQSSAGFSGFQALQNTTQIGAGKKYGLFSSGARNKQNELTSYTQGIRHTISGIVDTNTINNLASQSTSPFAAARFQTDINGGLQNLRAAAKGGKLYKFNQPKYDVYKYTLGDDWKIAYDPYGRRTAIPANLSRAQQLGVGPIPTQLGTIVYMGANGKLQNKPVTSKYNIDDFKQGGFIKNVLTKYQQGNSLKRSVQLFDVGSGKYVQIPIPLNKDQIAGRMPIRLANGTAVFMNGDGTVTSDRWETYGTREHLTPRGKDGTEINRKPREMNVLISYANGANPPFIQRINNNDTRSIKLADGTHATHLLGYGEADGKFYVFPRVQDVNGNLMLIEDEDPLFRALKNKDVLEMLSEEEAKQFTEQYKKYYPKFFQQFKKGGKMNVIPEGALHARKNHLTEIDDMYKAVTHKGIPVITIEDGGEVVQHAEVEHSEIIFTKKVTDKMEEYRKQGTDEAALECGKMLVKEILYNTDDRSGVIQTVE